MGGVGRKGGGGARRRRSGDGSEGGANGAGCGLLADGLSTGAVFTLDTVDARVGGDVLAVYLDCLGSEGRVGRSEKEGCCWLVLALVIRVRGCRVNKADQQARAPPGRGWASRSNRVAPAIAPAPPTCLDEWVDATWQRRWRSGKKEVGVVGGAGGAVGDELQVRPMARPAHISAPGSSLGRLYCCCGPVRRSASSARMASWPGASALGLWGDPGRPLWLLLWRWATAIGLDTGDERDGDNSRKHIN